MMVRYLNAENTHTHFHNHIHLTDPVVTFEICVHVFQSQCVCVRGVDW